MRKLAALEEFAARYDLLYQQDASCDHAIYSRDMEYRYGFARCWSDEGPLVLWVGVNPGKGDTEQRRRPTLTRCIQWSQRSWKAAGLLFANLFAARHNKPAGLRDSRDPIGRYNDEALLELSRLADFTVAAWGNEGRRHGRSIEVVPLLTRPLCLGVTRKGEPRHPLYVRGDTLPQPWPVSEGLSEAVGHRHR